jgi:AraC-like DNA-binding protein
LLEKKQINKHITLFKRDSLGKSEPLYCKGNIDALGIHINIKGKANFKSLVCEYCGEVLNGHTGIGLVNHYEGYCNIDADPNRQFIEICIKKDLLYKLLPQTHLSKQIFKFFESAKTGKDISIKRTNFKTQTLAKEIFDSPYTSELDKLYVEVKTLELIHTEFNTLFKERDHKANIVKLSSKDKEAIYYAKEILSKRIDNPPSIAELAKNVAINELKLKMGFHKFFQETPYNISLEYRLQEAKRLLEKSELNINEISSKVGYKYVQSFSNAYLKRFGVRPKDMMKSRKYYY